MAPRKGGHIAKKNWWGYHLYKIIEKVLNDFEEIEKHKKVTRTLMQLSVNEDTWRKKNCQIQERKTKMLLSPCIY